MKKLMFLIPFIFLLSIFFVNADCNLTSTSIGNRTALNVSINTSGGDNILSATASFWATSASTRNSSELIGNVSNTSNRLHVNYTFPDSMILEDSNDYTVWATCYLNSSQATIDNVKVENSTILTSVLFDRTKPAVPTGITYTNPVKDGNTIKATINLELANRCWIRFGGQNTERKAMTLSGSTCTFTAGVNNPPNSDYQAYISADDRTNETLSSVQNVIIRAVQSDGGGLFGDTLVSQTDSFGKGKQPFSKFDNKSIAVILILILLFLYFKNKK